jgi:hypothetical protein
LTGGTPYLGLRSDRVTACHIFPHVSGYSRSGPHRGKPVGKSEMNRMIGAPETLVKLTVAVIIMKTLVEV